MYNEERKIRFLEETRSSDNFGKSAFRTTEPYEVDAGQDLCELQEDTLQKIADRNFGSRSRTADSAIAFIRSYVTWCKEQGYPTNDGIYSVKTQMDEKMKRYMVASPKHLQDILSKSFMPVESESVDCIYQCYLWMAFAGLEETETVEVTVDEVNFTSMLIEHGGKSFELYRESIPAFRMACEATEFKYYHHNPDYTRIRSRFSGEHLMRGIRSDKVKLTTVKSVVQKAFIESEAELTYNKIRLSGTFYRAYEAERMGDKVNFDDYVAEQMLKRGSTYHSNYTRGKVANLIRRDLFDDYACWKAAFT